MEYWFLRDLDFLPEKLSDRYPKLSNDFWNHRDNFKLYTSKEEAIEASKKVRKCVGMLPVDYSTGKNKI